MADIQISPNGGATFAGPRGVDAFLVSSLTSHIKMYMRTGMIPTRGVTISRMLDMAGGYTGKRYKRGQGEQAVKDLEAILANRLESGHTTVEVRG
jgi:hypothetical protein